MMRLGAFSPVPEPYDIPIIRAVGSVIALLSKESAQPGSK